MRRESVSEGLEGVLGLLDALTARQSVVDNSGGGDEGNRAASERRSKRFSRCDRRKRPGIPIQCTSRQGQDLLSKEENNNTQESANIQSSSIPPFPPPPAQHHAIVYNL